MGATKISDAVASGMLTVLSTALDGSGATLTIYALGSETVAPETADVDISGSGYETLAELELSADAFGVVTAGTNLHSITAEPITDCTSAASGSAEFFRGADGSGTVVIQGNCGTSNTYDMVMNTVDIVSGATVQAASWVITLPQHEA